MGFCRTLARAELFSGLGELAKNAAPLGSLALLDACRPRLLGGKHAEGFRKALSSDRINADAGGSGQRHGAGAYKNIYRCLAGDEFTMDDKMLMELLALGIDAKMCVRHDCA